MKIGEKEKNIYNRIRLIYLNRLIHLQLEMIVFM